MDIENNTSWSVFFRNVAFLRKKNGLAKKDMAKLLGIGVGSLTKIEKGELPQRLSANIIYRIYKEFGIKPSDQFDKILEIGI